MFLFQEVAIKIFRNLKFTSLCFLLRLQSKIPDGENAIKPTMDVQAYCGKMVGWKGRDFQFNDNLVTRILFLSTRYPLRKSKPTLKLAKSGYLSEHNGEFKITTADITIAAGDRLAFIHSSVGYAMFIWKFLSSEK